MAEISRQNTTNYEHPQETNLLNLHKAMEYNASGEPIVRTSLVGSDSAATDAFGSMRTSSTRILGEYRYMYGSGVSTEMNDKLAGSGALVADLPRNCYLANVTTASGDRVVRQTKQYHPYISGTSNKALITFKFDTAKANLVQAVGLFDDQNGIFFRMNGLIPEVVIRKSGSDTEVIPQTSWNVDKLNGTGSSTVAADFTKTHILIIDYQWLGVGRVRIGFVIDGAVHYAHYFNHANVATEVYTNQPSLPIRWEIYNSGTVASSSQLMIICGVVFCEGSDYETGFTRSISTGNTTVSLTTVNSSNGRGILAIRLKNTLVGKQNHSLARLLEYGIVCDQDIEYKVVILPGNAAVDGGTTWANVPGYGWCEYAKNFTLASNWADTNNFAVVQDGFGTGSINNKSGTIAEGMAQNRTTSIYQNYDATDSQILAIIGYRLTADAIVRANMRWMEVK